MARPWGWGMGSLLWVQALINVLLRSLQWCMHYRVLLRRVITTLHCICHTICTLFYYAYFVVVVWTVSHEKCLLYIINVLPVFFRNASSTLAQPERVNHMAIYIWVNIWRRHTFTWTNAEYHEWENPSFRLISTSPWDYSVDGYW